MIIQDQLQEALARAKKAKEHPKLTGVGIVLVQNQILMIEAMLALCATIDPAKLKDVAQPVEEEVDQKPYPEKVKDNNLAYEMEPVISSNVESIGFKDGTMRVQFKNKSLYHYYNVPVETFDGVKKSQSVGSALNRLVIPQYKGEQVFK